MLKRLKEKGAGDRLATTIDNWRLYDDKLATVMSKVLATFLCRMSYSPARKLATYRELATFNGQAKQLFDLSPGDFFLETLDVCLNLKMACDFL